MSPEHLPHPSSEEGNRIIESDVAREAAEAERPLRNVLHHGKGSLIDKPDLRRDVEKLADAVGGEAAQTAQKLKQVHKLIRSNHDILRSAGVLGALVEYAEQLEKTLSANHRAGK
jgi:hypothetical protein